MTTTAGSSAGSSRFRISWSTLPGWVWSILLLVGAIGLAPVGGGLTRLVFCIGCLFVGTVSWRQSPESHLKALLMLLCFAPFTRRVVDYYVSFDELGLMLIGPLATMLVPVPRLFTIVEGRTNPLEKGLAPATIILSCVAYAMFLSMFKGAWLDAFSAALKWIAPLLYAMVIIETGNRERLLTAAADMFQIILPVMGLYGMLQYVDPPEWDRYWLDFAKTITAGLPLPYEIRVFSTLNGPASFATFTAIGIVIVSFLRPPLLAGFAVLPAGMALILSQYRTAWLSLALSIAFCTLFASTRTRSAYILATLFFGGMVAITIPSFNDALMERFETFSQGTQDGSFQERLQEFVTLWESPQSSLAGVGFSESDPGAAGNMPVDGMIIACWLMMGIVVGFICLSAFVWAASRMIARVFVRPDLHTVVLGGLGCGYLFQMPFASVASGELGFLFWAFAAMACIADKPDAMLAPGLDTSRPPLSPARFERTG